MDVSFIRRGLKAAGGVVRDGVKSFTRLLYEAGRTRRSYFLPGSHRNWLNDVGDGTGSSTVTAPLFWVARTFPEAPPALWRKLANGQEEKEVDHELLRLLERPNPYFTGVLLWMATILDYYVDGNGYWIKARNGTRRVKEIWFAPHWSMVPRGTDQPGEFLTHYEYSVGGRVVKLPPEDVVHFRFGVDSEDPRLGRAPLKSVLREVFTDDEAAQFTASLLSNMGVPGLMVSPEKGVTIAEDEAKETKTYLLEKFAGDRRGEPIVMTGATKIEQFGFSPEQLLLRELRRIPEERVTAVMGVPAIVAGLGAGLDRSTFTNMGEAREAAYESGIIPTQRILAEDIRFQLLPDFEPDPHTWRFGFDLAKVRVLQEDLFRQAQRHALLYREGLEMRSEGRRALGLDVDASRDDVFRLPLNTALENEDSILNPNSETNGNGSPAEAERAVRQLTAST